MLHVVDGIDSFFLMLFFIYFWEIYGMFIKWIHQNTVHFKWSLLAGKVFLIKTFKFAVLIPFLHFTIFVAYMKLYVKK